MDNGLIKEAIILAGGLGARLQNVIADVPKPMALINNRPFLEYVFDFLITSGIRKIFLAVGYKAGIIKRHFGNTYKNTPLFYVDSHQPLGTGGSIRYCLPFTKSKNILAINGDCLFQIDLKKFAQFHKIKKSDFSIALKKIKNPERYGLVEFNKSGQIINFKEKQKSAEGFISGGYYIINKSKFNLSQNQLVFSLEKDFLEKYYKKFNIFGYPSDSYFIDIGTPESYQQAQRDLS